jgi:hypothetical protein
MSDDATKTSDIQRRLDGILNGRATSAKPEDHSAGDDRLFASYLASDSHRAGALASIWMDVADGGAEVVEGLTLAVDAMYESLGRYPFGMVEHAAKLFLIHYRPARNVLSMCRLDERHPELVKPSSIPASPRLS